jgi:hypothetical protein
MGSIEFPSTPIGAKIPPAAAENKGEVSLYHQATFAELDLPATPEIELGNCLVTSPVTYRKRVKGNEWQCYISVEPDLMHPEQEGAYEAFARNNDADQAHRARLRPGDRAMLVGTPQEQTILLENGNTTTMNRFYVTHIEVSTRSPRKSITVYEHGK